MKVRNIPFFSCIRHQKSKLPEHRINSLRYTHSTAHYRVSSHTSHGLRLYMISSNFVSLSNDT